jgi:hypothetical protein
MHFGILNETGRFFTKIFREQVNLMSHNSYNNIKKYAAFIFMVFAVLSGSSDRIGSESYAGVGTKAFIDILASSRILIPDTRVSIGQIRVRLNERDNDGFREFVSLNSEEPDFSHIQLYVFPLVIIVIYYLNNIIQKNNIWKNAVF